MNNKVPEQQISFSAGRLIGPLVDAPVIVSLGVGVDSVAMLVGLKNAGCRPDAILFAHVGSEHPRTYAYLSILQAWLKKVGFPQITICQYRLKKSAKHFHYLTLAGNCIANRTLPSISFYGRKGCSQKWKGAELDAWVSAHYGELPCYRLIGYDAGSKDSKRFCQAIGTPKDKQLRPQDHFCYPLQLWQMARQDCIDLINLEGMPSPGKSACFFCGSTKPEELHLFPAPYLRQICILEANASPNLREIKGIWARKMMTDYIRDQGLLPADEIDRIWEAWSKKDHFISDPNAIADEILWKESGWEQPQGESPLNWHVEWNWIEAESWEVTHGLHGDTFNSAARNVADINQIHGCQSVN